MIGEIVLNILKKIPDRVTVRISGSGKERFFNFCSANYIRLSGIRTDEFGVLCSMHASDFKKIRSCVRKSGVHVSIVNKSGVGIYMRLRRKRYGFFAGAFIAVLFMIYLTSCIWVIDIKGNETVSNDIILQSLEKHGLYVGSVRFGRNLKQLQNKVLIDVDSLAWLWVNIDGTRAIVKVREKGSSAEPVNPDEVYNIVALQSGRITDIVAKSGQMVVNVGDVVNEGDLLISGISTTAFRGNRYIHSDGSVMAQTWREKSGEYHHTKTVCELSGRQKRKRSLNIFGKNLKLYLKPDAGYKYYEKSTKTKNLKIFNNIYLPLTFTTDTFCEIIRTDVQISDSEVVSAAVHKLTEDIEAERGSDAKTLKKEYEYHKLKNGNLIVTVSVESNENIAVPVKMEIDKSEENASGENS